MIADSDQWLSGWAMGDGCDEAVVVDDLLWMG